MQEKYKAVELSCISGRSKSGRSKLGRNGDGKGVLRPPSDLNELEFNKDKKETVIAHRSDCGLFLSQNRKEQANECQIAS